ERIREDRVIVRRQQRQKVHQNAVALGIHRDEIQKEPPHLSVRPQREPPVETASVTEDRLPRYHVVRSREPSPTRAARRDTIRCRSRANEGGHAPAHTTFHTAAHARDLT